MKTCRLDQVVTVTDWLYVHVGLFSGMGVVSVYFIVTGVYMIVCPWMTEIGTCFNNKLLMFIHETGIVIGISFNF